MGLLDDAIREHLDLKRRRGADPSELERAEREALGPVRRGPEVAEEAALDEELRREPALAYDQDEEAEDWDEPGDEDQASEADESPVHADAPPAEASAAQPSLEPTPPPAPAESSAPPPAPAGAQTEEYEVRFDEEEGHEKGDDPLEETPEFLQDTPDHDRLWFEQRPPRDFDFDG